MRQAPLLLPLLLCASLPIAAHASDRDGPEPDRVTDARKWPAARISVAATGGMPFLFQAGPTGGNTPGMSFGPEVRAYFGRWHGGFASYDFVMSPTLVHVVEAGYSVRLVGSPEMRGVHGALYADVGPSFAFVAGCGICSYGASGGPSGPTDKHAMIGLRTGLAADLYLWNFTVGLVGGFRVGVPTIDSGVRTEGALSIALRVGFTFDAGDHVARQTAAR